MSAAPPQAVFSALLRLEDAVPAFLNGIFCSSVEDSAVVLLAGTNLIF